MNNQLEQGEKPKRKRGRPFGTTKATTKHDVARARCHMRDKNEWTKKAKASGQSLSQWIVATLNKADK